MGETYVCQVTCVYSSTVCHQGCVHVYCVLLTLCIRVLCAMCTLRYVLCLLCWEVYIYGCCKCCIVHGYFGGLHVCTIWSAV